MRSHNPRRLETLGQKEWSLGRRDGMITWGWSRDWLTLSPWSYDRVSLPHIGVTRRLHKSMTSFFLTIGPAMVACHWIETPAHNEDGQD